MHRKPLSFINQRIYADGVEPQNLSQYVQELKGRFNHFHRKMVQQEKSAIDLETDRRRCGLHVSGNNSAESFAEIAKSLDWTMENKTENF